MWDRLRRFGRDLTGRNDEVLLAALLGQLDAAIEAAEVAHAIAAGELAPGEGCARLDDLETRGDDRRRELIDELARILAPPIDREDLFRFSRSADDVLDNLRDLGREFVLYELASEPLLVEPLAGVRAGVEGLRRAVEALVDDPATSIRATTGSKKNDVRGRYQRAMAELLAGPEPVTGLTLRRRELLRRVDVVGLRLGEAADALSDGAVKRSR